MIQFVPVSGNGLSASCRVTGTLHCKLVTYFVHVQYTCHHTTICMRVLVWVTHLECRDILPDNVFFREKLFNHDLKWKHLGFARKLKGKIPAICMNYSISARIVLQPALGVKMKRYKPRLTLLFLLLKRLDLISQKFVSNLCVGNTVKLFLETYKNWSCHMLKIAWP